MDMYVCVRALTCFDALNEREGEGEGEEEEKSLTRSLDQCRFRTDTQRETRAAEHEKKKNRNIVFISLALFTAKRSINRSTVAYLLVVLSPLFDLTEQVIINLSTNNQRSSSRTIKLSIGTTFFCSSQGSPAVTFSRSHSYEHVEILVPRTEPVVGMKRAPMVP